MGSTVDGKYLSQHEGDDIDAAVALVRNKTPHITNLPQNTTAALNTKINKSDIISTVSDATDKPISPAGVKAMISDDLQAPMTQEQYDALEYKQNKYYFIFED